MKIQEKGKITAYVIIICGVLSLLLLQIMKEIQEHKIKIYEFPETDDEEENKLVKKIKVGLFLCTVKYLGLLIIL